MTEKTEPQKQTGLYQSLDGKLIANLVAVHTYPSNYKPFQRQIAQLRNVVNIVGKLYADRVIMLSGYLGPNIPNETFFKASSLNEITNNIFEIASQTESFPLTVNLFSFPNNSLAKLTVVSLVIAKKA